MLRTYFGTALLHFAGLRTTSGWSVIESIDCDPKADDGKYQTEPHFIGSYFWLVTNYRYFTHKKPWISFRWANNWRANRELTLYTYYETLKYTMIWCTYISDKHIYCYYVCLSWTIHPFCATEFAKYTSCNQYISITKIIVIFKNNLYYIKNFKCNPVVKTNTSAIFINENCVKCYVSLKKKELVVFTILLIIAIGQSVTSTQRIAIIWILKCTAWCVCVT